MCLIALFDNDNREAIPLPEEALKELEQTEDGKQYVFYKWMRVTRPLIFFKVFVPPIYSHAKFRYKKGWNKSNRKSKELTKLEKSNRIIENGIHACATKEHAGHWKSRYLNHPEITYANFKLVKVYVNKEDLVAVGCYEPEVVAMKVFIKEF